MTKQRYRVIEVSIGAAGLTARPAVVDQENNYTVKIFRGAKGAEQAERLAAKLNLRGDLEAVYHYVLTNWAVSDYDISRHTGFEIDKVKKLTRRLDGGLLEGTHVNQERDITWQTWYDIENDPAAEEKGMADFRRKYPEAQPVEAGKSHRGATGARYTDKQIKHGFDLRMSGMTWKHVAETVGVKSPVHFSKVVRSRYPKVK